MLTDKFVEISLNIEFLVDLPNTCVFAGPSRAVGAVRQRRAQRLPDDAAGQRHVDTVHRLAVRGRVHLPVLRAPAQRGTAEPAARAGHEGLRRRPWQGDDDDTRPTGAAREGLTRRTGRTPRAAATLLQLLYIIFILYEKETTDLPLNTYIQYYSIITIFFYYYFKISFFFTRKIEHYRTTANERFVYLNFCLFGFFFLLFFIFRFRSFFREIRPGESVPAVRESSFTDKVFACAEDLLHSVPYIIMIFVPRAKQYFIII